jgi:hypothetical protein
MVRRQITATLVVVVDAAAVVAVVLYICTSFHCELKDCISQSIHFVAYFA